MKFWMIVNIKGAGVVGAGVYGSCGRSMEARWLYLREQDAENELLRLQKLCPDGRFYLMESVAWAQESPTVPGVFKVAYVPA